MTRSATETRPSEARQRLLTTATKIFYAEGIHSVGVDRIIAEAKITRATFYRHFPGKEDLVLAYLDGADRGIRAQTAAAIASGTTPEESARAVGASIAQGIQSIGFRGCAFLNAVAEYSDPASPVHQAVLAHRQWFLETVEGLMAEITAADPGPAAQHFVMLRDGAMAAGCLFDPDMVAETFLRGINGIVDNRVSKTA